MTQRTIERNSNGKQTEGGAYADVIRWSAVDIGERLGFYEAIAEAGEVTEASFSQRVAMHVAHVRSWLRSQHEAGFLDRDAASGAYRLWCPLPQVG